MNRQLKKKAVWSVFWLFLFWLAKSIFHEFIYMSSAEEAVNQVTGVDQALTVKIANGLYDQAFYGTLAFILFVIWIGPVLNKVLGKQEEQW